MMKLLRIVVTIAFLAVSAVFVKYYMSEIRSQDNTWPVITIEGDELTVSADIENEELLKGVTATDGKDGDLTDKIIVESISKFFEPGVCKITYAVCDSDNHVSSATRTIRYKNYRSPEFTLSQPLLYYVGDRVNLSAIVGAKDVIDGDITNTVIVVSDDYKSGQAGVFHVEMKASNSKGDIVSLRAPMFIEERTPGAPVINLTDYIIYLKSAKKPDFTKYIESVKDEMGNDLDLTLVETESEINYDEEGAYAVHYYVTDSLGRKGHAVLTVVVEKK